MTGFVHRRREHLPCAAQASSPLYWSLYFWRPLLPKRIQELNRKRGNGTISNNDLPAKLRRNFPGYFAGMSLRQIAEQCFAAYGIGERWTGYA